MIPGLTVCLWGVCSTDGCSSLTKTASFTLLSNHIGTVRRSLLRSRLKEGLTKNVQLYLWGLLSSAVRGHTFVSALITELGLMDPEGCCVLNPNRKSIVKPRDLRAWFSLDHTRQGHRLTNPSFQEGGSWLDPRLCWEERTTFLFLSVWIDSCQTSNVQWGSRKYFPGKFPELPWMCKL